MIRTGSNPDQQGDPPAPSNSEPGPFSPSVTRQTEEEKQNRTTRWWNRVFTPNRNQDRDDPGPDVSQLPSGLRPVRCRISSVHHHPPPPPGIFPPFRRLVSLSGAQRLPGGDPAEQSDVSPGERPGSHRQTSSEPRAGSARGVGVRMLEGLLVRQAGPLQMSAGSEGREDATAVCIRADQSQRCTSAGPRSHWSAAPSGTRRSVSSLNKEITQIHKCTLAWHLEALILWESNQKPSHGHVFPATPSFISCFPSDTH